MKKNKERHSGCLHRSPACDMAETQPSACLREWETAYLQVAGKKIPWYLVTKLQRLLQNSLTVFLLQSSKSYVGMPGHKM